MSVTRAQFRDTFARLKELDAEIARLETAGDDQDARALRAALQELAGLCEVTKASAVAYANTLSYARRISKEG